MSAEPYHFDLDEYAPRPAVSVDVGPGLVEDDRPAVEAAPFYCGSTFADAELPVREVLATNADGRAIFRRRMTVNLAAKPGIGKTQMVLSLAVSASLGAESLGFRWTRPVNVLVLDLELPASEMQGRYRAELRGRAGSDRFRLVSSDSLERPLGALYAPEEQARLDDLYAWADVVAIDSASYGLPTEEDNSTTAWRPCGEFLLSLRRRDKLVLTSFHTNAAGTRTRGTSAKEQGADLVALLNRPADSRHEGAHFTLSWTKRRGVTADVARDFEAKLGPEGWTVLPLDDHERRMVLLDLLRAGMPVSEAADEAGVSRATAYRWRGELIETGVLGKPPGWDKRQGRGR